MIFPFKKIEAFASTFWQKNNIFHVVEDPAKPKYYVLDMFPYPSGSGLHVGHPLGYIASDIVARFKRQQGFCVLHPMGFDAFGLPAEQYALQTGRHPAETTAENINRYKNQLKKIGFSFDWNREVQTSDPKYYRWTQWIFLQLFNSWYNNHTQKAEPLKTLEQHFAVYGTAGLNAAQSRELFFADDEWSNYSEVQRQQVLMNYRLAYLDEALVNWCPELGTVLANDEVKDGKSERGGHPVFRKPMRQWFLRITAYAERLLNDLDTLAWSNAMKEMQRNWIGRSEGATIFFKTEDGDTEIEVFTTRPDTIFGATFMVLAPEHPLVEKITTVNQQETVTKYVNYANRRSDIERQQEKKITGVDTGSFAINPFTKSKIPIWLSEYVLIGYGTGAIMAVPSDDERDYRFAQQFGLKIIDIIDRSSFPDAQREDKVGVMINSGFLSGKKVKEAIPAIIEEMEDLGIGAGKVNYRLRDAGFSRQRYWGEPFPIIYKNNMPYMAEDELPLTLPEIENYEPTGDGSAPLSRLTKWTNLPNGCVRETNTMPGYAGSSWYFLRYMDPQNNDTFVSKEKQAYWKNVDLYVGGTEHAVGHLLYARLWNKFLFDYGYVTAIEPFERLVNQGMIQGRSLLLQIDSQTRKWELHVPVALANKDDELNYEDFLQLQQNDKRFEGINAETDIKWQTKEGKKYTLLRAEVDKMSKRYLNTVNPDDVVAQYGADVFRLFEMFLGPIEQHKPWNTKGIEGVSKFMRRFWQLFFDENENLLLSTEQPTKEELKILHQTIKKVTEDIEKLSFNTSVSAFMIAVNQLQEGSCKKSAILLPLVSLIAPFAPHTAEFVWQKTGQKGSVADATWPVFNEEHLHEEEIEYPISINGKLRTKMMLNSAISNDNAREAVLQNEKVQKWIEGKPIKKFIHVPGRIINIVV